MSAIKNNLGRYYTEIIHTQITLKIAAYSIFFEVLIFKLNVL